MKQRNKTREMAMGNVKDLGPFSILGEPPVVPSVDEVYVPDRVVTRLLPGQVVEPEAGYEVHGPLGLLSCGPGAASRLLSLTSAFEWMRHKGIPRTSVVYAVFAPLIQWDEADEKHRRQVLYVVNGEGYANALSLGDRLNPKARAVWEQLDFSYQDTYSMGTVREIADFWDASWPGYVEDPSQFYQDGWIKYCNQSKDLAKSNHGPMGWEEEYRTRYYLNQTEWRERCTSAVRLLSRLAVPLSVAHELWGWGHAVASEAQPCAVAEEQTAPAIEAQDVTNWHSLVLHHKSLFESPAAWPDSWRRIALEWRESRGNVSRGVTTVKAMAEALGVSRDTVKTLLKRAERERNEERDRAWAPPAAA